LPFRDRIATTEVSPLEDLNRRFEMEGEMVLTVSGRVTDANSGLALEGASVRVVSNTDESIDFGRKGKFPSEN
jgi:hypothetical protein